MVESRMGSGERQTKWSDCLEKASFNNNSSHFLNIHYLSIMSHLLFSLQHFHEIRTVVSIYRLKN